MIGDMICKLRKQKELSQSALGKILNLSASAIGMYDQNRRLPDTDTIIKLCSFFSVSADYILELSENEKPYEKSMRNDDVRNRIEQLMDENELDAGFVASTSNIRKRRLLDILNNGKKPDTTELRGLAECFNESTDYVLGITDVHMHQEAAYVTPDSFPGRLRLLIDGYSEQEVSMETNIPIWTLRKLINNEEIPSMQMLCSLAKYFKKSTDFLLALNNTSREPDINGNFPYEMDKISLERLQELLEKDTDTYMSNELGLTEDEYFNLYHYGFIPHISVINRLCKIFNISADYLLGISDSKLTIIYDKENNEDSLLKSYRILDKPYRKDVDGYISRQILQQKRDSYMRESVAVDEKPEKTGTDNLGK